MTPTRRFMLTAGPAALLGVPASAFAATRKRFVYVLADGGWDVTYCLDPKQGIPTIQGPEVDEDPNDPNDREAVETFSGIPIQVNDAKRPAVRSFFESWGSAVVAVNGIWVGAIAHDPCRRRILTGQESEGFSDLSVIAGAIHGADLPVGSFDCSGVGYSGPLAATTGALGQRAQLATLLDPSLRFPPAKGVAPDVLGDMRPDVQARIASYLTDRRAAYQLGHPDPRARLADLEQSQLRAVRLRDKAADLAASVKPGSEPQMSDTVGLTVELLAREVCSSVLLQSFGAWDTHINNVNQHGYYDGMFTGLSQLLFGLEAAGILQDTLVVVSSEMTRTPTLNEGAGKDHWGHTSALLIGAGLQGGRAFGGTNDLLESLPVNLDSGAVDESRGELNKFDNFAAGVLERLDIDPTEWLPGVAPWRAL